MTNRTDEEILSFVTELWKDDRYPGSAAMNDFEAKIVRRSGAINLTVEQMYEAPGLNLAHLRKLADFFGTENINDDDRFGHGGCETCDYGSCYGFTLTIRPAKSTHD